MVRGIRILASAAALGAALLAASPAFADARAELEKGRAAYLAHNFEGAEERLRALLDPATGTKERPLVTQARMYLGATLIGEGKKDQAGDVFEKLILDDPTYDPDPLSFPGEVVNTFIDVRSSLQERIKLAAENAARTEAERKAKEIADKRAREAWLKDIQKMASEEEVTFKRSRLVASVPFGAGQFQNGNPILGWTFLGVESALVIASAITLPMYAYAHDREAEEIASDDIHRMAAGYHDRQVDIRTVNFGIVGAFIAVTVSGIIQANAAFVPETTEKKKRDVPPVPGTTGPTLAPVVGATTSGVFLGLKGATF